MRPAIASASIPPPLPQLAADRHSPSPPPDERDRRVQVAALICLGAGITLCVGGGLLFWRKLPRSVWMSVGYSGGVLVIVGSSLLCCSRSRRPAAPLSPPMPIPSSEITPRVNLPIQKPESRTPKGVVLQQILDRLPSPRELAGYDATTLSLLNDEIALVLSRASDPLCRATRIELDQWNRWLNIAITSPLEHEFLAPFLQKLINKYRNHVTHIDWNCPQLTAIAFLHPLPHLMSLELNGCPLIPDNEMADLLPQFPSLVNLSVVGTTKVTASTLQLVQERCNVSRQNETSNDMEMAHQAQAFLVGLSERFANNGRLKIEDLQKAFADITPAQRAGFFHMPRLVIPEPFWSRMTDKGLAVFLAFFNQHAPHVQEIWLNNCWKVAGQALSEIRLPVQRLDLTACAALASENLGFLTHLPELKTVSFAECEQLTDVGLTVFFNSAREDSALDLLDLSGARQITGESFQHLKMPIKILRLAGCASLTKHHFIQLMQPHILKSLERLEVRECPQITEELCNSLLQHREALVSAATIQPKGAALRISYQGRWIA